MKIYLSILLFAVFSLIPNYIFGQTVTGVILSANDSLPITMATIRILKMDSTFIKGTVSDSNGLFTVDIPQEDSVKAVISFMGFSTKQIQINGVNNNTDLGKILLYENSMELGEIVVKADNLINKVDKAIIFPTTDQLKLSSSSFNLLQNLNLPGLYIDALEQKININGSQPIYMINGVVKTKHDFLTINPKQIARIEYENSPSIRHIDKGVGGVINIILKKNEKGGSFWGSTSGSPMTGFLNSDIYFSYNILKSEFSINYFNNWRNYTHRRTNNDELLITEDNTIERKFVGVNSPFGYLSQGLYLNYTYQHDKNAMLSITLRNNFGKQHTSINGNITETYSNSSYFRYSKSLFNSYIPALDIFFNKKLKNNQSLEINVVGTLQDGVYKRNLKDSTASYQNEIINKINNSRKSIISEFVYRKSFAMINLNLGYQNRMSTTSNIYTDASQEEEVLYENNNYIYGGLYGVINKLSYSIGTGVKILSVNNEIDKKRFIKNQSILSLMYLINEKLNVKLSTFYTPHLPTLSQLSDVTQKYDDIMSIKGNPQLKAAYTIGGKLFINYKNEKFNLNFTSGYRKLTNNIFLDVKQFKEDTFISEFQNAIADKLMNVEVKCSYLGLLDHINLYSTIGYNSFHSSGKDFKHHLNDFYWDISAQMYWDKWTLSAYYVKPKKNLLSQIVDMGENNSQITLGYKHNNLDLFAAVKYPFEKNGWKWSEQNFSKVNPSETSVFIKDNSWMVVLGITYSFNFGKGLKKMNKNLQNSDQTTNILKVQE